MPYHLNVTIPTMVLEHALAFGTLEAVIIIIIFAYIQRIHLYFIERNITRK